MKTKKNLFICLLTVFMSVFAFFGIMTMSTSYVSADSGIFEMKDAAGIRLGDHSGIRFFVEMDETHKAYAENNEYGFLVFPQEYLTTKLGNNYENFYEDFHNNPDVLKVIIEGTKNIYTYSETDYGAGNIVKTYAANAALLDVKENNFKIKFTCVAYVVDDQGKYIYAINEDLGKSMQEVASKAYFDTENVDNEVLMATYGEESTTFNYNLGSTDNPILITDAAQLSMISEEVEAGTTDYAGMNFQLASELTIDDDTYTPIAADFAGKIDTNGVTVNGKYYAVKLVEDAENDLTGTPIVENCAAPSTLVSISNSGSYNWNNQFGYSIDDRIVSGAVYAGDYRNYFVASGTSIGVEGDYTGNVAKTSAVNNKNGWFANVDYELYQLEGIANYYTHVKFYVAVTVSENTEGWEVILGGTSGGSGLIKYATQCNNQQFTFDASNAGKWVEFTVPVNCLLSQYAQVSASGQNRLSLMALVNTGTDWYSKVTYYVSDLTLVKNDFTGGMLLDIDETNYNQIYNENHGTEAYVENSAIPATIKGLYDGNAVAITHTKPGTQGDFVFALPAMFEETKNKIISDYDYVKIWVAIQIADTTSEYNTCSAGLLYELGVTGFSYNLWQSYLVPVEDFFTYVGQSPVVTLFKGYNASSKERIFYIGDIELVTRDWVVDVQKNMSTSITPNASTMAGNTSYVSYDNLPDALKNSDVYKGNAIRSAYLYNGGCSWDVAHGMTTEKLTALCNEYNTVKFYVALATNTADGKVYKTDGTEATSYYYILGGYNNTLISKVNEINSYQYKDQDGDGVSETIPCISLNQNNVNTWLELTISSADFLAFVGEAETFSLARYWYMSPLPAWNADFACRSLDLYFGNIEFTNVIAE